MQRTLQRTLTDLTMVVIVMLVIYLITLGDSFEEQMTKLVSSSFLQLNTIFLSILIEALPFVLIGVLIAGFIQIFVTEAHVKRWIPKNKYLAILMSCVIGALFPACECGIVPIVRRLVEKGVPIYAGVGFMLTGPLINPIVILSTYMAFGNDMRMAGLRMGIGFVASIVIAIITSIFFKSNQLKKAPIIKACSSSHHESTRFRQKLGNMLRSSVDEFFSMGKFLILGAFIAAFVQVYIAADSLFIFGNGLIGATVVMMILAFLLSLCSEADAFIGASFSSLFPSTSVLAFLIYGPMIDLKNTIMLAAVFKGRFVISLVVVITIVVLGAVLFATYGQAMLFL